MLHVQAFCRNLNVGARRCRTALGNPRDVCPCKLEGYLANLHVIARPQAVAISRSAVSMTQVPKVSTGALPESLCRSERSTRRLPRRFAPRNDSGNRWLVLLIWCKCYPNGLSPQGKNSPAGRRGCLIMYHSWSQRKATLGRRMFSDAQSPSQRPARRLRR